MNIRELTMKMKMNRSTLFFKDTDQISDFLVRHFISDKRLQSILEIVLNPQRTRELIQYT